MSSTRGLVTDTIAFSSVDGPGNRFVVFLQGCNFDCIACHNPYTINVCNNCGIAWQPALRARSPFGDDGLVDVERGGVRRSGHLPHNLPVGRHAQGPASSGRRTAGRDPQGGTRSCPASPCRAARRPSRRTSSMRCSRRSRPMPALRHLTCFVDSNGAAHRGTWTSPGAGDGRRDDRPEVPRPADAPGDDRPAE